MTKSFISTNRLSRKFSTDLFQAAAALETELEFHSSSEEEEKHFQPLYTPTPLPSTKNSNLYLLTNKCLDSAFSQGTILVQVEQTTTLYPFKPSQVNSQILFGNLSNFAIFLRLLQSYPYLQLFFKDQTFS